LTFDNAATDRLAFQVLAARDKLVSLSGLAPDQIIFLGHSMGARVALQAATMDVRQSAGLILLGTQVNLETNVQSEVFTGVTDTDMAWIQSLGPNNPLTNVLMISGRWDDILSPANARLLLNKLVGGPAGEGEPFGDLQAGTGRELLILDRLLHNYEIYAPLALTEAKEWASTIWGNPETPAAATASRRIMLWLLALGGIFLAVLGGERWAASALPPLRTTPRTMSIESTKRFLWSKLLLWVPAVPLSVLVAGSLFIVPLGLPVFNMIYIGFIGGYGLLMLLLYWRGWMPGVEGRLPFGGTLAGRCKDSIPRTLLALFAAAVILVLATTYARSGWFWAPPRGDRLVWLLLFTPPTALGFWIGLHEWGMLWEKAPRRGFLRLAALLTGLVPFFLWTLFQAALGSLSGMVASLQGLIILALVLASGALVQRLAERPWLSALIESVLLYWLILPQGALFSL
jgi:hypothetical protein